MKTIALTGGILLALVAVLAVFISFQSKNALGSVSVSSEYTGVVYDSTKRGTSTLNNRKPTTIGTVVVSSTSPVTTSGPAIAFYDTASTTRSTTTMTAFAQMGGLGSVTPTAGDYTFDVMASSGVMIWVDPSFTGVYTITYR